MKNNNYYFLLIWIFFFTTGCSDYNKPSSIQHLRVAVLPNQNKIETEKKYQPLLKYLNASLNIKTSLILPSSYEEILQLFSEKKVDLALFGAVTYLEAYKKYQAVPLVMKSTDHNNRSLFLVKASSAIKTIRDLKGKTFSFGAKLSTSGHYMPRYYLQEKDIFVENFFSEVKYSGGHDKTARWVRDGVVDAGVAHSGIINEMYLDGRLRKGDITIIWETPSFPDNIWAVQNSISISDRTKIRNAFMYLSQRIPEQKDILSKLGGGYYLDAHHETFKKLEKIMQH